MSPIDIVKHQVAWFFDSLVHLSQEGTGTLVFIINTEAFFCFMLTCYASRLRDRKHPRAKLALMAAAHCWFAVGMLTIVLLILRVRGAALPA